MQDADDQVAQAWHALWAVPVRTWEASSALSRYRDNAETRRRVKVIGRLPGERSCLSLVWAVLDRASKGWRGLTMTPKALRRLQDLRRELLGQPRPSAPEEVIAQTVTPAA